MKKLDSLLSLYHSSEEFFCSDLTGREFVKMRFLNGSLEFLPMSPEQVPPEVQAQLDLLTLAQGGGLLPETYFGIVDGEWVYSSVLSFP